MSLLGTDLHHHQAFAGFVTETWFNSKNTDDTVAIAGYTLIRRDRLKRKGGGVCVYIRHLLDASCYSISNKFEVMWIKMNHCHASYYVACCYHAAPQAPL